LFIPITDDGGCKTDSTTDVAPVFITDEVTNNTKKNYFNAIATTSLEKPAKLR